MPNKPILLIEDEATDAALLLRAFMKAGIPNPVTQLRNGDEALAYLAGMKQYADRLAHPLPALIIMDIKLPGMSGLSLLQWMRAKRELKAIPVIVLSGDEDAATVKAAYQAGANSYLVKSGSVDRMDQMVKSIRDFWLTWNQGSARKPAPEEQDDHEDNGEATSTSRG